MMKTLHDKQKLTSRLSAYAAAAGALVALAPNTNAQVAYSGLQNLELNFPNEYLEIDIDTNLVNDFGFQLYGYSDSSVYGEYSSRYKIGYGVMLNPKTDSYNNSWITKMTSVQIYDSGSYSYAIQTPIVEGLEPGEMIDSKRSSWSNIGEPYWPGVLGVSYYQAYNSPGGSVASGWSAGDFRGEEKFIGVRFYIGTEQHYGWIRASMGDELDPLTIIDWAYELTPDKMILAGDGLGIDIPPSLRISGLNNFSMDSSQTMTITVPEEVTGFDISDISVTNGSTDNFTVVTAGWEYTLDVTAGVEGLVTIDIPDSAVFDLGGTANLAVSKSWVYDITAPQATFFSYTGTSQVYVDLDFSEKVTGFEAEDLVVTNGTIESFEEEQPGLTYYLVITVSGDNVTLELPAGTVKDLAGNENASVSESWTFDATAPLATLNAGITSTSDAIVDVDVLFSEMIYGFDISDFIISNGSATSLGIISDNLHYTLTVTADAAGQVIVAMPASSVYDYADNANEMTSISWLYQPVGLNPSSGGGITIYPNPVENNLHIKLAEEASIKLIDLSGNVVYRQERALNETIDVSGFTPGVYVVQIQDNEKVIQYKIIIE